MIINVQINIVEDIIMAYIEKPRYETKETGLTHQPVVICIDTSGSMKEKAEDGRTKARIVEQMINSLPELDLSESEKAAIDICILVFDDECRVLVDWMPLSDFKGGIELDVAGCTALGSAIIDSIDATRARRKAYEQQGIEARRAQIFLYTDGFSTEDMTAANKRSMEYLNREHPAAKMYTILIPPAKDPSELKALGEKVAILRAVDCVNGIPSTFKFLKDSVVAWSSSNPGETIKVEAEGFGFIDGQGGVKKNPDGGAIVTDDDIWSF